MTVSITPTRIPKKEEEIMLPTFSPKSFQTLAILMNPRNMTRATKAKRTCTDRKPKSTIAERNTTRGRSQAQEEIHPKAETRMSKEKTMNRARKMQTTTCLRLVPLPKILCPDRLLAKVMETGRKATREAKNKSESLREKIEISKSIHGERRSITDLRTCLSSTTKLDPL